MAQKVYKTSRKYKCPYCDVKLPRTNLVDHVQKKHEELIPEDYTASRAVYDSINGKNHGTCMICKKDVYTWNDKLCRYNNLCDNPNCRKEVRNIALNRHMKVYNKPTLLNDPEHQEKMLANRKISGSYTFTDGGKITYTGSYEKKCLEFMDKVLGIPSTDIQAPGPVLEYEYNGEIHLWITDIFYIPANLLIEIKDGGSNPNNRDMPIYRGKQYAKEEMITKLGTFNYIRLTNNDFSQLLSIMADMKYEALEEPSSFKPKIHINEEVGGMPPNRPPEAYIVPYGMNNVFDGFAYGDSRMDKMIIEDEYGNLLPIDESALKEKYTVGTRIYHNGNNVSDVVSEFHAAIKNNDHSKSILEIFTGKENCTTNTLFFTEYLRFVDDEKEKIISSCIDNGMRFKHNLALIGRDKSKVFVIEPMNANVIDTIDNVDICISPKGYYASVQTNVFLMSNYFKSIEELKRSDVIHILATEVEDYINTRETLKQTMIGGEAND